MKKFEALLLSLTLLGTVSLLGQGTIYIEYGEDCFEEFVYQNPKSGETVRAYHLQAGRDSRVVLEVDPRPETKFRKPSNTRSCNTLQADEGLVRNVNEGRTDIFLVQQFRPGSYKIYHVNSAVFFLANDKFIEFEDKALSFNYDYRPTDDKTNLATPQSKSRVFYQETVSYQCPKQFRFKQVFDRKGNEYLHFVLTEGVGVTEIVSPPTPPLSEEKILRLVRADGMPLKEYFDKVCKGDISRPDKPGKPYGSTVAGEDGRPVGEEPWEQDGHGRVYRDLNSGLYIDRKTWTLANLEYGGFVYVNGKQYHPNDPQVASGSSQAGVSAFSTSGMEGPKGCQVVFDDTRQLYIDLNNGLPADGVCNNQLYRNGQLVGQASGTSGYLTDQECFVYRSPSGIYIDGRTGRPANTICDGITYSNGQMVSSSAATASTMSSRSAGGRHIVQQGETVYSIARRYGLSPAQLMAWNGLSSESTLFPGMALQVMAPQSTATMATSTYPSTSSTPSKGAVGYSSSAGQMGNYHTVQKGETLFSIADDYGMSVDRLRALNNMNDWEIIYPGQRLKIAEGVASTAANPELKDAYEASSGRVIVKPKGEDKSAATFSTSAAPQDDNYTVQKGDTLWGIAQKHGLSVEELKKKNGLKSNMIRRGQVLKVK